MTTRPILRKGLAFLLSLPALPALAQQQDTTASAADRVLPHVVVTGQYRPVKPEDAVQRIRVIDAKKIAAMGAQNLRDVLLNEMNVSVSQDDALGSRVSIQGMSGQNVKILVDGVPIIGRQDGNIDISQINTYNVERIELVEGPMSVNFGTDALAGAINIITKSAISKKIEGAVNTYTESIGKYNANANLGYNAGKHTFMLGGSRNFFSGWDPKQESRYLDFGARPADAGRAQQWDAKEEYNANFQYSYKLNRTTLRLKSDYFHDIITNRGKPNGFYGYDAFDDVYRTTRFNNSVFANGKIFRNKTYSFLAAYNQYKREKNTYTVDLTSLDKALAAASDQDTSKYTSFNSRGTFSNSNPAARMNYEIGYDITIDNGTGKRILNKEQQIGDYAVYGSTEVRLVKELIARVGLRYAYNTAFATPLIPSLNLKYTLAKALVLRGSYARGFRAPSIKELYFEFKDVNHNIFGNTDLKPENSNNYNVAANYSFRTNAVQHSVEASAFYNSINDMITLAGPDSMFRYNYINIEQYKTRGVQLSWSGQYKGLNVTLNGSYIGRYNKLPETENSAAPEFFYTPELRVNVSYNWTKYNTVFSLFSKYTGQMPGVGLDVQGNAILLPIKAYGLADISVTKNFPKIRLSALAGCKNLMDVRNVNYAGNASGGSGGVHSASSASISVGTGRSYFLGLGYQFSK